MLPIATEYFTGVIDRFEGDLAVILLEADGEVVDEKVLERDEFPDDGAHADAILDVELIDGEITDLSYDREKTVQRKDRAQSRFDRLAKRLPKDSDEE